LEFVFAFNTAVTAASWTGASLWLLSVFCIAFALCLRSWRKFEERRRESVIQEWEPKLFEATRDPANHLPNSHKLIERRDLPHLLREWNYLHESIAGESKNGLNHFANTLGFYDPTVKLLKSPFLDVRLLAINTLGNLGEKNAYPEIENVVVDRDPIVSSWAWMALFRIDKPRTIEKYLPLIVVRKEWSPIFVARVLNEIDADEISMPLCSLAAESYAKGIPERQMSRLISYLILAHVSDYRSLINKILIECEEMEVLIACLRLVNSDDNLTRTRELIRHERWEVRLQAVLTLGRLAHKEDTGLLIDALNDADWWVRYRTAAALYSMPGMTEKRIEKLAQSLPNRFARDILRQVLTEKRLLCFTPTSTTLSR